MIDPDDYLLLSGIQHFVFCPRQWALIDIDQKWDDNRLTMEGNLLHDNVDNPAYRQKNGEVITLRRVAVASSRLGLYGFSDAVEHLPATESENAITHPAYPGHWHLRPVEYKHGKPKPDLRDKVQVVAQAICLEEMHHITISEGAIYYGTTHGRQTFAIDDELRQFAAECASQMHQIFSSGAMPPPIKKAHCRNCSLFDECMPSAPRAAAASAYIKTCLYEETP